MGANLDPVVAAQADVACASYVNFTASTSSIVAGPMEMVVESLKLRKSRQKEGWKERKCDWRTLSSFNDCWLLSFFSLSFPFLTSFLSFREGDGCTLYLRRKFTSVGSEGKIRQGCCRLGQLFDLLGSSFAAERSETTIKLAGTARFGL